MPNPIRGESRLTLADGRGYTLVLDHEALIHAEAGYGKPMDLMMRDAASGFVGATRALLCGALQANHPGATLAAASEMFFADKDAVLAAITEAANLAFPDADPNQKKERVGNGPAGKISGGSGAKRASSRKASGAKRRAPSS